MSSKDKLVIGESTVQRMMELAGTRALYKKSIIKESGAFPKEEPVEEEIPVEEEPVEEEIPVEDGVSEGGPDLGDDLIDSDVDGEDGLDGVEDEQSINTDQFVEKLAQLMKQAFNVSVTVSPMGETGMEGAEGLTDIDGEASIEEAPVAPSLLPAKPPAAGGLKPLVPPKLENRNKVSQMAQQIYEQVMAKIVKKSGVNLKESNLNRQEVKVKLEQKTLTKKPLNESAKDGQPHVKAPFLTSKTTPAPAKGRGTDKPEVKTSPKSNQNPNCDLGKK